MDVDEIEKAAREEIEKEKYRQAVELKKEELRNKKPLLHKLFPWVITIKRRT